MTADSLTSLVTPQSTDEEKLAFVLAIVKEKGGISDLRGTEIHLQLSSRPQPTLGHRRTGEVRGMIRYNHRGTVVVTGRDGKEYSISLSDLIEGLWPDCEE
jgi:hypothetical protein